MSRWSEAFVALSKAVDSMDTLRHSDHPPEKVSQSVNSVTAAAASRTKQPIPHGDCTAASWGEFETERSAILQYEGNIPRDWAEGFARLHPDRPPGGVPARRWLRFIDDIGLFLDSPFCAVAVGLGWGAYDLFGCDHDRPFVRIDYLGLLWLLDGGRVMALTADTATIKTSNGSILTYRRRAGNEPSNVLAWELE
jgi:hypothetical protein